MLPGSGGLVGLDEISRIWVEDQCSYLMFRILLVVNGTIYFPFSPITLHTTDLWFPFKYTLHQSQYLGEANYISMRVQFAHLCVFWLYVFWLCFFCKKCFWISVSTIYIKNSFSWIFLAIVFIVKLLTILLKGHWWEKQNFLCLLWPIV